LGGEKPREGKGKQNVIHPVPVPTRRNRSLPGAGSSLPRDGRVCRTPPAPLLAAHPEAPSGASSAHAAAQGQGQARHRSLRR